MYLVDKDHAVEADGYLGNEETPDAKSLYNFALAQGFGIINIREFTETNGPARFVWVLTEECYPIWMPLGATVRQAKKTLSLMVPEYIYLHAAGELSEDEYLQACDKYIQMLSDQYEWDPTNKDTRDVELALNEELEKLGMTSNTEKFEMRVH